MNERTAASKKNRLDAARPDFYNNLFSRQVSDNYFLLKVARFESWSFAHQNLKEGKKSKEILSDLRVKITLIVVIMNRRQWRWLRRRCVRGTRPGRAVQWVIRGRLPKVGHRCTHWGKDWASMHILQWKYTALFYIVMHCSIQHIFWLQSRSSSSSRRNHVLWGLRTPYPRANTQSTG